MSCLDGTSAPFDRFEPDDDLLSKLCLTRQSGELHAGMRTWCHTLALDGGEVTHAFLGHGTRVGPAHFGGCTVVLRVGGMTLADDALLPPAPFSEVMVYPDGAIPATRYLDGTHEFTVLRTGSAAAARAPERLTIPLVEPLWQLILMLRKGESIEQSSRGVHRLMSCAESCLSTSMPDVVRRAMHFLDTNWESGAKASEAARHVGLSRSHLYRAFEATLGIGVRSYVLRLRLHRAAGLLWGTPMSIGDVATTCGFYDQAHLSREMARHFHLAPQAFRGLAPCLGKVRLQGVQFLGGPRSSIGDVLR